MQQESPIDLTPKRGSTTMLYPHAVTAHLPIDLCQTRYSTFVVYCFPRKPLCVSRRGPGRGTVRAIGKDDVGKLICPLFSKEQCSMSESQRDKLSRRSFMKAGVVVPLTLALPTFLVARTAEAAKASKAAMLYQNKPHGKDHCSNCMHFIPGKTAKAHGTCRVVAGSISPEGWCVAYTRKVS